MKRLGVIIAACLVLSAVAPVAQAGANKGWIGDELGVDMGIEEESYVVVTPQYEDTDTKVEIEVNGNISKYISFHQGEFVLGSESPGKKAHFDARTWTSSGESLDVNEEVSGNITVYLSPAEEDDQSGGSGATLQSKQVIPITLVANLGGGSTPPYLFILPFFGPFRMIHLVTLFGVSTGLAAGVWYYKQEYGESDSTYISD